MKDELMKKIIIDDCAPFLNKPALFYILHNVTLNIINIVKTR